MTAVVLQNVINAESASAVVLYVVALAVLCKFTNKYTPLRLVVGAIAGQFLFVRRWKRVALRLANEGRSLKIIF